MVQTLTLSEMTNKQNTSVPPQFLMGFSLSDQQDPWTQHSFRPPQVFFWSVRMRNTAWVPSAWFMKLHY